MEMEERTMTTPPSKLVETPRVNELFDRHVQENQHCASSERAALAYQQVDELLSLTRQLEAALAQSQNEVAESRHRLRALLEGLEAKEIDTALDLAPATLRVLGMRIARAAKLS